MLKAKRLIEHHRLLPFVVSDELTNKYLVMKGTKSTVFVSFFCKFYSEEVLLISLSLNLKTLAEFYIRIGQLVYYISIY
jgi:hypothetical protein